MPQHFIAITFIVFTQLLTQPYLLAFIAFIETLRVSRQGRFHRAFENRRYFHILIFHSHWYATLAAETWFSQSCRFCLFHCHASLQPPAFRAPLMSCRHAGWFRLSYFITIFTLSHWHFISRCRADISFQIHISAIDYRRHLVSLLSSLLLYCFSIAPFIFSCMHEMYSFYDSFFRQYLFLFQLQGTDWFIF